MAMEHRTATSPQPPRRGPSSGHPVLRIALVWLVTAAVFVLLGWLLPGLTVTSAGAALAAAGLLGLINALVWPIFAYLALPLAVLTLGLAAIVLNGAAVAIVASLLPGIDVRDLGTAIAVALVLALANTMLTSLLTLDDEDVYYRRIIRRAARRVRPEGATDVPGVLFIQIDGLGMAVLRRALRDGNAPTLARWLAWRPDGPLRPVPASAGSCTAAPSTSRPSGGWKRRPAPGSSATTRARQRKSSGATRTGGACCTPTGSAGGTSIPATPCRTS